MASKKQIEKTNHLPHTVILYLDGSAGPTNPGFYGSGIHGYAFLNEKIGKKDGNKPNKYILTNIGYLELELLQKYQGGYETIIPEFFIDGYYSYSGISTNNVAELNAFIESVDKLIELKNDKEVGYEVTKIIFQTDSMYLINVANACIKDDKWKYEDKINKDYWFKIENAINNMKNLEIEYSIEKVKGHSTNMGNNIADRMAFLGRTESTRLNNDHVFKIVEAKNYWTKVTDRHPFLSFKQLFFTNVSKQNSSETMYGIMKYRKKDDDLGKKSHEACFGLVLLSEPDAIIENAISVYQENMKSLSILNSMDLSNLFDNSTTRYLELFGNKPFIFNKYNHSLNILEEKDIITDVKPNGLATQAMERILNLFLIVKEYRNHVNNRFHFEDITKLFYSKNEKNTQTFLIPQGINDIDIKVEYEGNNIIIPTTLGRDTLERNTLKKLEKDDVIVTLVIEKVTNVFISYYIIIELKRTSDISIWHNFYSNNIILPKK